MTAVEILIHVLVLVLLPPLLLGVIVKTKAAFAGRKGAPLLQVYFDIWKLLRKDMVLSKTTTWIFRAGPIVSLITVTVAGLLFPLGYGQAPVSFAGDLVLFAYLFGLGRFFTVLAAFDTSSPFEGMGGTREVTFACLAEPALFMGLLVLAKLSSSLSLSTMFGEGSYWAVAPASLALVLVSLFIVALAENCRIPVDDPTTHLELTMIHEAMVLDHSGPLFGVILHGAAMKLLVLGAVLVRLVMPVHPANPVAAWGLFVGLLLVFAVAVGVVESVMARLQMRHVHRILVAACLLSGFGVILLAR
ncbi:MAG TPA: NADH-quinone oxidoreductase subunit H [Polyangiaceae bacterium]|nr:NADH-quinone oxidoreductase subunit H [Polyangiaceae bacterium]